MKELTILSGKSKTGESENYESLTFRPGETICIVGHTGSGKSAFLGDIEALADGDTVSGRRVRVDGTNPREDFTPIRLIASISQHTQYVADMTVEEFLEVHKQAREVVGAIGGVVVDLANNLTGEAIDMGMKLTDLSGGQSRALMIADAIIISDSPVILLDEIENAGIFKDRVLGMIKKAGKVVIFVSHDPKVALNCDRRIVMKNGGVMRVIERSDAENEARKEIFECDMVLSDYRMMLRDGEVLS
jgi:ABC-type lipoprotein export system ATPase subunit